MRHTTDWEHDAEREKQEAADQVEEKVDGADEERECDVRVLTEQEHTDRARVRRGWVGQQHTYASDRRRTHEAEQKLLQVREAYRSDKKQKNWTLREVQ